MLLKWLGEATKSLKKWCCNSFILTVIIKIDMNNAVYMFGCSCGAKGRPASIVQSKISAKLFNTKRDSERLKEHINYLAQAGIEINGYPAIVVENRGERVTLIDEWIQQH